MSFDDEGCLLYQPQAKSPISGCRDFDKLLSVDQRGAPRLGRGYSCLDPEGHLWHFGTYDPWAGS